MRRAGFSLTEVVVVMGIMGVLASLVLPAFATTRSKARVAQCTNNLRNISQALLMYDIDHDRTYENYPDRLTHLYSLGYLRDQRVFICPMDGTKATTAKNGYPALKPVYKNGIRYGTDPATAQVPSDDKADWAERLGFISNGMRELNCSYLYEFSTRPCQSYTRTVDDVTKETLSVQWNGSGWASDWLVGWYNEDRFFYDEVYLNNPINEDTVEFDTSTNWFNDDWVDLYLVIPANPLDVDRDGNGTVTMQEAKFWQMEEGDVYTSGYAGPSDRAVPQSFSPEPYDMIFDGTYPRQHGYPRGWMPIVRCFYHQTPELVDKECFEEVLNLSVDGNTFYSAPGWEQTAWRQGKQQTGFEGW